MGHPSPKLSCTAQKWRHEQPMVVRVGSETNYRGIYTGGFETNRLCLRLG